MASSSQVRQWWSAYLCDTSKYQRVTFPGAGRTWSLLVASPAVPIFQALANIMVTEPYLFRESAGGTYNCRPPSLHAYALAIDLNPSRNPYRCPVTTDMPPSFIARVEGIRANSKQALTWGGRWLCANPPDPMHFQINVAPADCKNVTYDGGTTPPESDEMLPLTYGQQSEDVRMLQNRLNRAYNAGLAEDADYGNATAGVVAGSPLPSYTGDKSTAVVTGKRVNARMWNGLLIDFTRATSSGGSSGGIDFGTTVKLTKP